MIELSIIPATQNAQTRKNWEKHMRNNKKETHHGMHVEAPCQPASWKACGKSNTPTPMMKLTVIATSAKAETLGCFTGSFVLASLRRCFRRFRGFWMFETLMYVVLIRARWWCGIRSAAMLGQIIYLERQARRLLPVIKRNGADTAFSRAVSIGDTWL